MRALIVALMLLFALPAPGADVPPDFSRPEERERYQSLLEELRCLVCQNQSLADSHAPLAQDLRDQVLERMRRGDSDEEIVRFLVARYGDFVLYRPPFRRETWLLWLGPFVLLLGAGAVLLRVAAGRRATEAPPLTADEQRRLQELDEERDRGP